MMRKEKREKEKWRGNFMTYLSTSRPNQQNCAIEEPLYTASLILSTVRRIHSSSMIISIISNVES